MMPPPKTIEAHIGERRITNWTPVGISLCEELDVGKVLSGISAEDKEKQQQVGGAVGHWGDGPAFIACVHVDTSASGSGSGCNACAVRGCLLCGGTLTCPCVVSHGPRRP